MINRDSRRVATSFLGEFRNFIQRGNVIELAVAVIVGGAFNKIIDSLVSDLITPALLQPALRAAGVEQLGGLTIGGIKYGLFLAAVLNFLIIAFTLFLVIRAFEKAQKRLIRSQELSESNAEGSTELLAHERLTNALVELTEVIEHQTLNRN